ncbi:MAG TPA: hypothetical protein DEF41_08305 [Desulfovibrio sp.]|nr:hypothetical protein [Desulfovibrio sp.]
MRVACWGVYAEPAVALLRFLIERYRQMGIVVKRALTDNGSWYVARQFRAVCSGLGLKHIRTRPYTPRTNGEAERFIRIALKGGHTPATPTQKYKLRPFSGGSNAIAILIHILPLGVKVRQSG